MSMYKRPPLRVREVTVASGRPKPGSFLDAIVNPPPTIHSNHPKKPIYQKDAYLSLLKRSYEYAGLEYKEPKKRVTKNDKKNKKEVYSQKHIRIKSEMIETRRRDGSLPTTNKPLLTNGCK